VQESFASSLASTTADAYSPLTSLSTRSPTLSIAAPDAACLYTQLYHAYGDQRWWPGDSPAEVVLGAVLTQNTVWANAAQAIGRLKAAGLDSFERLLAAPEDRVKACIRPAGCYNVKYGRLMNLLRLVVDQGGLCALGTLTTEECRTLLLSVKGIGPETADCILLYALGKRVFVVDRYTRRLLVRLGHDWARESSYDTVQSWFSQGLGTDPQVYNECHALIVQHGKAHCRATPRCYGCPMARSCVTAQTPAPSDATSA